MVTRIRDGDESTKPTLFKQQADATLNQANPVSGTQYTVLDTTKNVRILGISAQVTWTVQPTPLEVHITIDGQTYVFAKTNPVTATNYMCEINPNNAGTAADPYPMPNISAYHFPFAILEGRSIKVQAETTGGTTSNLSARVIYAKM